MAYNQRDTTIELLQRTLFGFADFRGRSRRKEVVVWYVVAPLIMVFATALLVLLLPRDIAAAATIPLALIFALGIGVPSYALLVRRLHDQDRSGRIALMLPLLLVLDIGQTIYAAAQLGLSFEQAFKYDPWPWFDRIVGLVTLVIQLLPGTHGPNRFGENPRSWRVGSAESAHHDPAA